MDFLFSSGPPFFVLALCVCPLLCLCYTDFRAFWAQEKPAFRPFFTKILRQISSRSFVKKIGWIFASVFCYVSPWLTKLRVSYFSYKLKMKLKTSWDVASMNFFCKLYGAEGKSTSVSFGNQSERCFHPISMQNDKHNKPDWKIFSMFLQCKRHCFYGL